MLQDTPFSLGGTRCLAYNSVNSGCVQLRTTSVVTKRGSESTLLLDEVTEAQREKGAVLLLRSKDRLGPWCLSSWENFSLTPPGITENGVLKTDKGDGSISKMSQCSLIRPHNQHKKPGL